MAHPWMDRCRTAVAIAGGTVNDYAPLLETVNDISHALPGVLKCVVWEPFHEIERRRPLKYMHGM
jgi:hypothetical protein